MLLLLLLLLLCTLPAVLNDYLLFIVNTVLVYCLVAVGFNVVLGYLGQLAFANAAFFGVGAYATGLCMVHLHFPFSVAILVSAVAGGIAGLLVGLPALRIRGYYLAISTLAFGELMRWVYIQGDPITFGPAGFDIPPVKLFDTTLGDVGKFYLFLALVVVGVTTTGLMLKSRYGRAFAAVRNNEVAAASTGIDPARIKVLAFIWSGLVVGLAGAMYAALNGRLSPDSFGISQLLIQFSTVMVGGLGSLAGSIIGAVLLTGLPEILRDFPGMEEIIFSLILIIVLFAMPKGIGGFLSSRFVLFREQLYREDKDA